MHDLADGLTAFKKLYEVVLSATGAYSFDKDYPYLPNGHMDFTAKKILKFQVTEKGFMDLVNRLNLYNEVFDFISVNNRNTYRVVNFKDYQFFTLYLRKS